MQTFIFESSFAPSFEVGGVLAEALNVHEQTGLTPAQLQARVAELEGALAAVTGALDELGDQPDHQVCPDVWRRFDCEAHVINARKVLNRA